jgi:hypothetical protein
LFGTSFKFPFSFLRSVLNWSRWVKQLVSFRCRINSQGLVELVAGEWSRRLRGYNKQQSVAFSWDS